jgi:hypothetical protein
MNISADPLFVDEEFHLSPDSPCRGAGDSGSAIGQDLDGDSWSSPPSMGADEVVDAWFAGPLTLTINCPITNALTGRYHALSFQDAIVGHASRIAWDFGDGVQTNASYFVSHWWTNPGHYTVTSTIYNNDNPGGINATVGVQISPVLSPVLASPMIGSNGFGFSFTAQTNAYYYVQYATNLDAPTTWETLQTISSSRGGATQIGDPAWTNTARFYRVLAE